MQGPTEIKIVSHWSEGYTPPHKGQSTAVIENPGQCTEINNTFHWSTGFTLVHVSPWQQHDSNDSSYWSKGYTPPYKDSNHLLNERFGTTLTGAVNISHWSTCSADARPFKDQSSAELGNRVMILKVTCKRSIYNT